MKALLKDPALEKQLVEEGYVVVPFFDPQKVERMRKFFLEEFPDDAQRMYASSHSDDIAYKYKINDWIKDNYAEPVSRYFQNQRVLGGTYIVKPGGGKGTIYPHQDWNLVDERRFRSVNCWVPLVDTNAENGAFCLLPKSHSLHETFRGPNVPERCKPIEMWLFDNLTMVPMKAGEAMIYDHRLIHGSWDNNADYTRVASACAVTSADAELRLYHYDETRPEGRRIEEFVGDSDFLLSNDRFDAPGKLQSLGILDYATAPFEIADFAPIVSANNPA